MDQINTIQSIDHSDGKLTSRKRPMSAQYLRLKIAKGPPSVNYSFLQYPNEEKNEILRFFWEFFRIFLEASDKSHSAEKCKKHPLCCKI